MIRRCAKLHRPQSTLAVWVSRMRREDGGTSSGDAKMNPGQLPGEV